MGEKKILELGQTSADKVHPMVKVFTSFTKRIVAGPAVILSYDFSTVVFAGRTAKKLRREV